MRMKAGYDQTVTQFNEQMALDSQNIVPITNEYLVAYLFSSAFFKATVKSQRETRSPIHPYSNLFKETQEDRDKLMNYVRHVIFGNHKVHNSWQVVQKAQLLALIKNNVSYKHFKDGVWNQIHR